ncbi:sensor histidine kinase [Ferruginibacter sp. HRS2-29]|uniref:tetratricopeptide repeat-containing sensor histidine kinase n=1 Tax=Ferruginibacter sp. HRS2-29 TaxID=2487334 RepID=UPI0020CD97FC|nr:sensor histidine kinase [Ferruginibacter sp. HRS2-29]MCP9750954.1 sensor histidine kinase [Ferruginibacter sp. HRS2-29]
MQKTGNFKRLLFLSAFLCGYAISLAQQPLVDSVATLLKKDLADTARARAMIHLAKYTEPLDLKKAHDLYRSAADYALKKKLYYFAGMALRNDAMPYHRTSDYKTELTILREAIGYLEKQQTLPVHKKELGQAYNDLGNNFRSVDRYDTAVSYFLKGIAMQEEAGLSDMTVSYTNIAAIYQQMKLPAKQDEYSTKALAAAKGSKAPKSLFAGYLYRVHYYLEVENFDAAKKNLDTARLYLSNDYPFALTQTYYTLSGVTFQQLKQYDTAIKYYEKAYEHARENKSPWNMVEPKIQIGHIYNLIKKYPEAEAVTLQAVKMAEDGNFKGFMQEGYGLLSVIYEQMEKFREANDYTWKYSDLKDSIQANDRKEFALDLEKKYETEKKDNQLKLQKAELKQKDIYNYILLGGALVIVVLASLFYRNYRQRQKFQQQRINELETQQQLTATEAVLKGEEQERSRLAKDLHDGLGGMLSGIKYSLNTMKGNLVMTPGNAQAFERSIDMLDSSIKEMRRVAHNMMPEALVKFGLDTALKDFCNDINQSGALKVNYQSIGLEENTTDELVAVSIYRIVQELVNNAIRHAAATTALVQVTRTNDIISITVEDDGKGFDSNLVKQAKGIGWTNIRNRVEFLKGKIDVQSQPGQGTSVLIEIKP